MRHQQELGKIVMADPDVATVAMSVGGTGADQPRPLLHHPEAARRAQGQRRPDHRPAAAAARQGRGRARCSCRRRRTSASAAACRARSISTRCRMPTSTSSTPGRRRSSTSCKTLPRAARRRDRPADAGHDADADDRPRPGRALRHPAAADRRHALRRVRPAAGDAVLHPDQHLSRDPGGAAAQLGRATRHAEHDLREVAVDQLERAAVVVRALDDARRCGRCRSATRASSRP